MKQTMIATICMVTVLGISACGGPSSQTTSEPKASTEEAAEEAEEEETAQEEESSSASPQWEVGEGTVVTWKNSIGTDWVQIIVPVTNTGTDNLYLSSGTMDLEDETGHLVESRSMVSAYPEVLQPGETGVYYEETTIELDGDHTLSVLPHVQVDKAKVDCIRYDVSDLELKDEEYGGVVVTGRVENTTDEDGSLVYVTAILYGDNDQIIGQAFTILNNDLTAGDKIGFSASTFSVPDTVTADAVSYYDVFSYPTQFQF